MRHYLLFLLFVAVPFLASAQTLTAEETALYTLIMSYRKEKGLPAIPLSKSLTLVAQTHVKDLETNRPVTGSCNLHSWSDKGTWTPCCYTPDHTKAQCMWSKPAELTSYKGNGFEISYGGSNFTATAQGALNSWKTSSGHNAVIINAGMWSTPWNAIGIGIYGGYAVVWFGNEEDK